MKIYGSLLALCLLQGATAFVVKGPQALKLPPTFLGSTAEGTEPPKLPSSGSVKSVKDIWNTLSPVKVQGSSLRTWSFETPDIDRVQVLMKSEGRPIHANIELWQGPNNTPQKMGVYIEDGDLRPFSAIVETPGAQNAIKVRNTASMEYPLSACVEADMEYAIRHGTAGLADITKKLADMGTAMTLQGGAVRTWPFSNEVASVQIMLTTDGRPLNARIENLQGPNNKKQTIDIYLEDGNLRPFFIVIETPGAGNVVRIVNTSTLEYPLKATVEPYMMQGGGAGSSFFDTK
jgi:hypothetical protein